MSKYSGKFDVYDLLMLQKTHQNGNILESDELECFEEFKKKTGGVLYQKFPVKVTIYNQETIKQKCKQFDYKLEKEKYVYTYWGKTYNLKELNKKSVYIDEKIEFNTLLDLIPYYPYIVSMSGEDENKLTVYISEQSEVETRFRESLVYNLSEAETFRNYYHSELQKHYLEVCKLYFLDNYENRYTCTEIKDVKEYDSKQYKLFVEDTIDYMHPLKYVWSDNNSKSHWSDPKFLDEHNILISKMDYDGLLREDIQNNNLKILYVRKNAVENFCGKENNIYE